MSSNRSVSNKKYGMAKTIPYFLVLLWRFRTLLCVFFHYKRFSSIAKLIKAFGFDEFES